MPAPEEDRENDSAGGQQRDDHRTPDECHVLRTEARRLRSAHQLQRVVAGQRPLLGLFHARERLCLVHLELAFAGLTLLPFAPGRSDTKATSTPNPKWHT